ncbi:MAG TPA: FeoA family protein [Anaerohalosphaeraceae bacterium]|jgi:Fe2+ transport system protein FeoA|nr:FeoA family protein [Anaerohalosphaeraceae bacterium]
MKTKSDKEHVPMSLDQIETGKTVRIDHIEAGHGLKNRLAAMGLLADQPIRVMLNDHRGQVIIAVKNSRVVLGRGMSHKIFVR